MRRLRPEREQGDRDRDDEADVPPHEMSFMVATILVPATLKPISMSISSAGQPDRVRRPDDLGVRIEAEERVQDRRADVEAAAA